MHHIHKANQNLKFMSSKNGRDEIVICMRGIFCYFIPEQQVYCELRPTSQVVGCSRTTWENLPSLIL